MPNVNILKYKKNYFLALSSFTLFLALAMLAFTTEAKATGEISYPNLLVETPTLVQTGQAFPISISDPQLEEVTITWNNKTLKVDATENNAGTKEIQALLPVGLDDKEGRKTLKLQIQIAGKNFSQAISIDVEKKKYPEQQLKVDPKFVDISKADLDRHNKERARVTAAISDISPIRHWNLPFVRPVSGDVSSLFGVTRVFNGKPRSAHKGLDLRGAEGTPIKACAAGTVVLAEDQFFSGNIVYIDHGLGVFTAYAHMSQIDVKEGDVVQAGDVIGKVGHTGRATGPHLHFSTLVLTTGVDPEVLLDEHSEAAGNTGSPVGSASTAIESAPTAETLSADKIEP